MSLLPRSLERVIESFQRLPGVGPKTAQRLAFYLLHVPQEELDLFAEGLQALKRHTVLCSICKNVTEKDPCIICSNPGRDQRIVCIVEQPTDVLSIEKTGKFAGVYHVLHGCIDPLNNIGPDEIYIADVLKRLKNAAYPVEEVILATNPNMEGEATSMYITRQIRQLTGDDHTIKVTRLAHGLPVGADIEYADEVTLSRALEGRTEY
ncbi:MAG: recombination mediator RecR [Patescibacteria group bacterium]